MLDYEKPIHEAAYTGTHLDIRIQREEGANKMADITQASSNTEDHKMWHPCEEVISTNGISHARQKTIAPSLLRRRPGMRWRVRRPQVRLVFRGVARTR